MKYIVAIIFAVSLLSGCNTIKSSKVPESNMFLSGFTNTSSKVITGGLDSKGYPYTITRISYEKSGFPKTAAILYFSTDKENNVLLDNEGKPIVDSIRFFEYEDNKWVQV